MRAVAIDMTETLLKAALNTVQSINQIQSICRLQITDASNGGICLQKLPAFSPFPTMFEQAFPRVLDLFQNKS